MRSEWARTLRTGIQVVIGLLPALPVLVSELGLNATTGVVATVLAVAATVTRIMQIPAVDQWVQKLLRQA